MEIAPVTHPGIVLKEEFAEPYGLTQAKLASLLGVGMKTINEIYNEKRGITPLMALKLSRLFDTTPDFWINFQFHYDLYKTYKKEKESIDKIKSLKSD